MEIDHLVVALHPIFHLSIISDPSRLQLAGTFHHCGTKDSPHFQLQNEPLVEQIGSSIVPQFAFPSVHFAFSSFPLPFHQSSKIYLIQVRAHHPSHSPSISVSFPFAPHICSTSHQVLCHMSFHCLQHVVAIFLIVFPSCRVFEAPHVWHVYQCVGCSRHHTHF